MNPGAIRELRALLMGMAPKLGERAWVYAPISEDAMIPATAFAVVREDEGACAVIPAEAGPKDAAPFARITLQVNSDLEAVGLTSAVATALASSGVACNIIAGLNHDHLLVPWERREDAMIVLEKLSRDAN
jgi:hypothetical protein